MRSVEDDELVIVRYAWDPVLDARETRATRRIDAGLGIRTTAAPTKKTKKAGGAGGAGMLVFCVLLLLDTLCATSSSSAPLRDDDYFVRLRNTIVGRYADEDDQAHRVLCFVRAYMYEAARRYAPGVAAAEVVRV